MRQLAVVWIAVPRETDPCIAHFRRERARTRSAAGHRSATIRGVEDERQLGAVKCARSPVKHRSPPGKPIIVCGRCFLRGLAFALRNATLTYGRRRNARKNIAGLFRRMILTKYGDDLFGFVAVLRLYGQIVRVIAGAVCRKVLNSAGTGYGFLHNAGNARQERDQG